MREVDCPCGLTLIGTDDSELIRRGREHTDAHHAGKAITDDFIRDQVTANARHATVA